MNKTLFWTGTTIQAINLFCLFILFFGSLDWSFLTAKFLIVAGYVTLNLVSIVMIIVGAALRD